MGWGPPDFVVLPAIPPARRRGETEKEELCLYQAAPQRRAHGSEQRREAQSLFSLCQRLGMVLGSALSVALRFQ